MTDVTNVPERDIATGFRDAVTELVSPDDGAAILANARALDPLLRAGGEGAEQLRRLPRDMVDALRRAGLFRMAMPEAWGGPEVDTSALRSRSSRRYREPTRRPDGAR